MALLRRKGADQPLLDALNQRAFDAHVLRSSLELKNAFSTMSRPLVEIESWAAESFRWVEAVLTRRAQAVGIDPRGFAWVGNDSKHALSDAILALDAVLVVLEPTPAQRGEQ